LREKPELQKWPFISIITPSLNNAAYIAEAVESVLYQDCPYSEHIVMDGGSTDGTLDILRTYAHLKIISEPDRGIYHALNKGIGHARGEVIGFLNSDDFYEKNVFHDIAERFAEKPSLQGVRGSAIVFEDKAPEERRVVSRYTAPHADNTYFYKTVLGTSVINAHFFRKNVFDRIGLFDMLYTIAADRELILRCALSGLVCMPIERVVYWYRQHSGSRTMSKRTVPWLKIREEHLEIAERYMHIEGMLPELKGVISLWHSREASHGVLDALKKMKFQKALRYGIRGHKNNDMWIREFLSCLAHSVNRLVRRGPNA
jgi:glycosyltransferase involved in cell wall biosynthesis